MFGQSSESVSGKSNFLEKAKSAREERSAGRHKDEAIVLIQAVARGFLDRRRLQKSIRNDVDELLAIPSDPTTDYKPVLKPASVLFKIIRRFLFIFNEQQDKARFEYLCKYILKGMNVSGVRIPYVSVVMVNKAAMLPWIQQVKVIVWRCCAYFKILKPENVSDMRMIQTCLGVVVTFTSPNTWHVLKTKEGAALKPGMTQLCKNIMGHLNTNGLYPALQVLLMRGLARSKPSLAHTTLSAIITISLRPVIAADFSDKLMSLFLLNIFSVPAVVYHIIAMSQECLNLLITERVFKRSINLLSEEQSAKIIFNALEGNYALCLLANLIHLGNTEIEGLVDGADKFMVVVIRLLDFCNRYVHYKQSNLTLWHPVIGWFSQKTDEGLHEAMPFVVKQLQQLWSLRVMRLLFDQLFAYSDLAEMRCNSMPSTSDAVSKSTFAPLQALLVKSTFIENQDVLSTVYTQV